MVCYNFMPVFDWTRSDLARKRPDGSTVLAYNQDVIDQIDPEHMRESIEKMSNGFVMPGWEPERLEKLKALFDAYKDVDSEKLFNNLVYFLEQSALYVRNTISIWVFIRMIRMAYFRTSKNREK